MRRTYTRGSLSVAGALVAAGALTTACGGSDAAAGGGGDELVVAAVGADLGAAYKKILENWGEENDVDVTYVEQDVPTSLTKLSAQVPAGQVQYDVVMLNDVAGAQAKARGLTQPIEASALPNLERVLPDAQSPSLDGPFTAFSLVGMAYDPQRFDEEGWAPPEEWTDFVDPTYAECVVPPDPVNAGSGVVALAEINRAVGEDYDDIDATIEAMQPFADEVPAISGNLTQTLQLMAQGTACLGVGTQGVALQAQAAGTEVEFVIPVGTSSQGLPLLIPEGANAPDLAAEFINYTLGEDAQQIILDEALWTPVLPGVAGTSEESADVVTPEEYPDYQVEPVPVEAFEDTAEWGRKFSEVFGS